MSPTITRRAGIGTLLSGFTVGVALLADALWPNEERTEFLLLAAPAALLPAMLTLHTAFHGEFPRFTRLTTGIGLVGCAAVTVVLILVSLPAVGIAPSRELFAVPIMLVGLMSLWVVLSSLLGALTGMLPLLLASVGIVAGASWIALVSGSLVERFDAAIAADLQRQITLWSAVAGTWSFSYLSYTIWLSWWFFSQSTTHLGPGERSERWIRKKRPEAG